MKHDDEGIDDAINGRKKKGDGCEGKKMREETMCFKKRKDSNKPQGDEYMGMRVDREVPEDIRIMEKVERKGVNNDKRKERIVGGG